eukprot:SAG22_NODE_2226_length_2814_cov_1.924862_2_plen_221_part_00
MAFTTEEETARVAAEKERLASAVRLAAAKRENPWAELWFAAEQGDGDRLAELCAADGCDVNVKDGYGESALVKANRKGHHGCARLLLEHGAELSDLPPTAWTFEHCTTWFLGAFSFSRRYLALWEEVQLDGEALLELDDRGLSEDVCIGVSAHRKVILKAVAELRVRAAAVTASVRCPGLHSWTPAFPVYCILTGVPAWRPGERRATRPSGPGRSRPHSG